MFIPIIDDTEIESLEEFHAHLNLSGSQSLTIFLDPMHTTVNIISNDCKLEIRYRNLGMSMCKKGKVESVALCIHMH